MALIGLLFVALVCLVLGLVLASGPFLIGSIAASVIVAVLLFRQRDQLGGRRAGSGAPGAAAAGTVSAPKKTALVTGTAFASTQATTTAVPSTPAEEAALSATPGISTSAEVWVVDGRPLFHVASCERIADADAQAIPYGQALEDGFSECSKCRPVVGVKIRQVWVVDGKPDYHLDGCEQIVDADSEQIPRAQAVEDGFTPCRECRPDGIAAAGAPVLSADAPADRGNAPGAPAAATPAPATAAEDSVWVVDGRPRYHLAGCLVIAEHDAEQIPRAQAVEDGFMPCSMCQPDNARSLTG